MPNAVTRCCHAASERAANGPRRPLAAGPQEPEVRDGERRVVQDHQPWRGPSVSIQPAFGDRIKHRRRVVLAGMREDVDHDVRPPAGQRHKNPSPPEPGDGGDDGGDDGAVHHTVQGVRPDLYCGRQPGFGARRRECIALERLPGAVTQESPEGDGNQVSDVGQCRERDGCARLAGADGSTARHRRDAQAGPQGVGNDVHRLPQLTS